MTPMIAQLFAETALLQTSATPEQLDAADRAQILFNLAYCAERVLAASVPDLTVEQRWIVAREVAEQHRPGEHVIETVRRWLPEEWKGMIKRDAKGNMLTVPANSYMLLKYHPDTRGTIRFNLFTKNIEVVGGPLAGHKNIDAIVTAAQDWIHTNEGCIIPFTDLGRRIVLIAEENPFDPIQDYLQNLWWDGVDRVTGEGGWLSRYAYVEADSSEYILEVGKKFLLAAVSRAMEPGSKTDVVLIIEGPQGLKKCLGRGTPVLMFDGTVKPVEQIKNGDLLMGPDSRPRLVRCTTKGTSPLRRIVPIKGDPWVCNDAHILTVMTRDKNKRLIDVPVSKCATVNGQTYVRGNRDNVRAAARYRGATQTAKLRGREVGRAVTMRSKGLSYNEIGEQLGVSWAVARNAVIRGLNKRAVKPDALGAERIAQVRTGVDFPSMTTTWDPYLVGLWLGDGTVGKTDITNTDPEVIEYCRNVKLPTGFSVKIVPTVGRPHIFRISFTGARKRSHKDRNQFLEFVRALIIDGEKRIPRNYLANSREKRLALLAGLIDTDGCLSGGCYLITTKYAGLRDDILFLARSLGFAAYSHAQRVKAYPDNTYFAITISGDLSVVPCLISRKKAAPRKQIKDVLQTGFSIEDIGEGEFFGFELSGDGRFLLGDFTITHNSSLLEALFGPYYADAAIALGDKDSKMLASAAWGIELPDMASFKRSEQNALKAFFAARHDTMRVPYGRSIISFPRRCVFATTTNDDEYLSDPTGNRRYWPVRCTKVDLAALIADRDQIWAQAMHIYRASETCSDCAASTDTVWGQRPRCAEHRWWPSQKLSEIAKGETEKRQDEDLWAPTVRAWLANPIAGDVTGLRRNEKTVDITTANCLVYAIGKPLGQCSHFDKIRVGKIFRQEGYAISKLHRGQRKYVKTDAQPKPKIAIV